MKLKLNILFLFILLVIYTAKGQSIYEEFETITTKQGLSESTITAVIQDKQGFMWFGTNNGLNKFDGYKFTVFKNIPSDTTSIAGNFIRSLYQDPSGIIWIGTGKNGLCSYNPDYDYFTTYNFSFAASTGAHINTVFTIIPFQNNSLLLGTSNGIFRFDIYAKKFSKFAGSQNINGFPYNKSISSLLFDKNERLWIGTDEGLFLFEKNSNLLHFNQLNNITISSNIIHSLFQDGNGRILIGTNEGLNIFNEQTRTVNKFDAFIENAPELGVSEIHSIIQDNRNDYWFGTFGNGVIRYSLKSATKTVYQNIPGNSNSIANNHIVSLFVDASGLLWIGTYGSGINTFNLVRSNFNMMKSSTGNKNSLAGEDVYAICDDQEALLIGTDNGLTIYDEKQGLFLNLKHIPADLQSLPGNQVYSILKDHAGNFWIGTSGGGLCKLNKQDYLSKQFVFQRFNTGKAQEGYFLKEDIFALFENLNKEIWVGTSKGISVINSNGELIKSFQNSPKNENSLSSNEIQCFYKDKKGDIWVGTYNGLNRYNTDNQSFIRYLKVEDDPASLPNNTVYSICEDKKGNLWVGTDGGGICYMDSKREKITTFTMQNGLPDNVVYGVVMDNDDNLWASTNNGICRISPVSDGSSFTFEIYNSENLLPCNIFNIGASHRSKSGVLYFGCSSGLTFFNPDDIKGNKYVPPVVITDFQLFFKKVPIRPDGKSPLKKHISKTRKIVLSYRQNVLYFEFSALNYIQNNKNRYAYMMENFNSDWVYVDPANRTASFTLKPGRYKFRVKASNNNGVWNEEGVVIEIIIKPPFYQTFWFYSIVVLVLIGLIVLIIKRRTRKLVNDQKILEQKVIDRTHELAQANENLKDEITERIKAEEALRISEAKFRQLIEIMNEGFVLLDRHGVIQYANQKAAEMFRMKQANILFKTPEDLIDQSNQLYVRNYYDSIKKDIKSPFECQWIRGDNSKLITIVSPQSIINEFGEHDGTVAVLTDITDLKVYELELQEKNNQLNATLLELKNTQSQLVESEKMASLGQLTAGIAHEINNPINFVSGNVKPLRRDFNDILQIITKYDELVTSKKLENDFSEIEKLKSQVDFQELITEIHGLLNGIDEGANRTASIVRGLRNFSRLDEDERKSSDIHSGIDSTLIILQNKLRDGICVEKEFGQIPQIMCYPGQLNQVFMNIINNAVQAMKGDGVMKIKTWTENNTVKISIKDSGSGMSEEVKKRIFEPFFTTKDVGKGTGLGLSISYGIIEKHHGNIEVFSEPGKGSEFVITLPAYFNS